MPTDPVPVPTGRPIVFYSTHQDDETLFMGQVIAHHCLAGREVHVVLCSDGSTSGVFNQINGVSANGWWGGYHYPAREGYSPISVEEFVEARDREFLTACGQLGVWPDNIHIEADRGAAVTEEYAREVITRYDDRYPDAGHYTSWWGDALEAHAIMGAALKALRDSDPSRFDDARWLVKPEQAAAAGATQYKVPTTLLTTVKEFVRRAGWSYRAWAPRVGMFAVGYHSVGPSYFDDVERGDPNWIVRP